MAIQLIPILKAIGPLVANASGLVASILGFRKSALASKTDERIRALEEEVLRAGEVLAGVTEQLQAIAEALRLQGELNDARAKKAKIYSVVSLSTLGLSIIALALALRR